MRSIVRRDFRWTPSVPRVVHTGVIALLVLAALAAPLALAHA